MNSFFSKFIPALVAATLLQAARSQVVISQYYEGASFDKYIELHNPTAAAVSLDSYWLGLFSNSGAREAWKTGGVPGASIQLTGVSIPPGGYYLIAHATAGVPLYAATNANLKTPANGSTSVINFSGDDSIVLYNASSWATSTIVDAFSLAASNAADKSYYRLSNGVGFDLDPGSSSNLTYGNVWAEKSLADVLNATAGTDPWRLEYQSQTAPPTLITFTLGADALTTGSRFVSASFTSSNGVPTEVQISESPSFTGAIWLPVADAASKRIELSPELGSKTVYFKVKNTIGESNFLSDTIDLTAFTPASSTVLITQYYEGTSNNKYLEISNLTNTEISLAGWFVAGWTNAAAENWKVTGATPSTSINLSALTIPANGSIVLGNSSAATPIAAANLSAPTGLANGNINHTGNDSLTLHNGAVSVGTLVDVASFTNTGGGGTGEGVDKSFVRLTTGTGFDFALGSAITSFPTVWKELPLATVNAALATQNEYLGTYPGSGPSGYTAWAEAQWPGETDTAIIGFEADPDGDGIKNGAEYSFVLDPKLPSGNAITVVSVTPGVMNFSHKRPKLFTGVTLTYQWSANLSDWVAQGVFIGADSITTAEDSVDTSNPSFDVVQAHASISEGDPKKFFIRGHAVK